MAGKENNQLKSDGITTLTKKAAVELKAEEIRRDFISGMALMEGMKWGLYGTVAGGLGVLAMNTYPNFNRFMSASAKTSIPLMSGAFLFILRGGLCAGDAIR